MQAKLNPLVAGIRQAMIGNLTAAQFEAAYAKINSIGSYDKRYATETPQTKPQAGGTPDKA